MAGNNRPARGATKIAELTNLQARFNAVQAQREQDLVRFGRAISELQRLRREIAARDADEAAIPDSDDERGSGVAAVEDWQLRTAADRAQLRGESSRTGGLFAALWAKLFLNLARRAARRRDYASAELYYQAVLAHRPRPFIWRQLGNMLAGQGLYSAAIQSFDNALALAPEDAETLFVKSVALRRLGKTEEAHAIYLDAARIDPRLVARQR